MFQGLLREPFFSCVLLHAHPVAGVLLIKQQAKVGIASQAVRGRADRPVFMDFSSEKHQFLICIYMAWTLLI